MGFLGKRWLWFAFCLIGFSMMDIWAQNKDGEDLLALLRVRATEGAAADYLPDSVCGTCHVTLYESYQHVGMARSFARPAEAAEIERFGEEFYHEATKRYYRIDKDGEGLVFYRYQKDDAGKPINEFQVQVDWIMGSGNRARSYIFQNEWGEMFMLPIGWYSEDKVWDMSPGFEHEDQLGVNRKIQRECMFCHNAFAETPLKSDERWKPHVFPQDLPQGTGCQRCHGPGADHVRTVLSGKTLEAIRASIVNPRKLPPKERDSVCFQCHMLPSVAIVGARHFDRDVYSFRPGQVLSDYLVHVETINENPSDNDFEINHHGYRFFQSKCYSESEGEMACISCHDPHVKRASADFRAHASNVCLDCHQGEIKAHAPEIKPDGDCISCHMPTRRTRDVIQVTMTDHRIARGPFDLEQIVKPFEKVLPPIVDVKVLPFGDPPRGAEADLYRNIAFVRGFSTESNVDLLEKQLAASTPKNKLIPFLDLAEGQLDLKRYAAAKATAERIVDAHPDISVSWLRLGIAQIALKDLAAGRKSLLKSIQIEPTPEAYYNLGLVEYFSKDDQKAVENLDIAIGMRPNFATAWLYKGRATIYLRDFERARVSLARSLEIEPGLEDAYFELVRLLLRMGNEAEAERYRKVGLRMAQDKAKLQKMLQTLR